MTISAPWLPSAIALTSCGLAMPSSATRERKRALSSTPAMPITRLGGKSRALGHEISHLFKRIRNDDDDGLGCMATNTVGHATNDFRVHAGQVGAGHARLAGAPCRHDDVVRTLQRRQFGVAFDPCREVPETGAVPHVEREPGGKSRNDVDEHHAGEQRQSRRASTPSSRRHGRRRSPPLSAGNPPQHRAGRRRPASAAAQARRDGTVRRTGRRAEQSVAGGSSDLVQAAAGNEVFTAGWIGAGLTIDAAAVVAAAPRSMRTSSSLARSAASGVNKSRAPITRTPWPFRRRPRRQRSSRASQPFERSNRGFCCALDFAFACRR